MMQLNALAQKLKQKSAAQIPLKNLKNHLFKLKLWINKSINGVNAGHLKSALGSAGVLNN